MKKTWPVVIAFLISIIGVSIVLFFWLFSPAKNLSSPDSTSAPSPTKDNLPAISPTQYPIHTNITATTFWVGEAASANNAFIPNSKSAWDENWLTHYGGSDNPNNRNGFYPTGFIPKENPFYFALPYNDFDANGNRKKDVAKIIYWVNQNGWSESQSMLKNQWIKIDANGKTVYAQWEDVGPFGEDDNAYVFGTALPENQSNNNAGIDLSPAIQTYLGLDGENKVDWQFVKEEDVPTGPWKDIITTS